MIMGMLCGIAPHQHALIVARLRDPYDCVPLCADGDIADRTAHRGFHEGNIVPRTLRQVFKMSAGADVTVKPGQILIDRFCRIQVIDHGGEIFNTLPSQLIGNAHRDFFHIGQHVQLGQCK